MHECGYKEQYITHMVKKQQFHRPDKMSICFTSPKQTKKKKKEHTHTYRDKKQKNK